MKPKLLLNRRSGRTTRILETVELYKTFKIFGFKLFTIKVPNFLISYEFVDNCLKFIYPPSKDDTLIINYTTEVKL